MLHGTTLKPFLIEQMNLPILMYNIVNIQHKTIWW